MEKIIPITRRPDITFHANGQIYITARVARILDLTEESCINVVIHKGEYLLMAQHLPGMIGNHTARCHAVNSGSLYYRANSILLSRAIIKAAGAQGATRVALMCGAPTTIKGKTYLPIITRTRL